MTAVLETRGLDFSYPDIGNAAPIIERYPYFDDAKEQPPGDVCSLASP